jgi:hypothetical protein
MESLRRLVRRRDVNPPPKEVESADEERVDRSSNRLLAWLLGVASAALIGAATTSISALQRIATLEANYGNIQRDVSEVKVDVKKLLERSTK